MRELRRWLRYALEDLGAAEKGAADPEAIPRHACFNAQQAAEKALKAVLVYANIEIPKRHDIDGLRHLVPQDWLIAQSPLEMGKLTIWAIEARYPTELPDATERDAQAAAALAREAVDLITGEFAQRGIEVES
jgi:HEPN domain-containing protein